MKEAVIILETTQFMLFMRKFDHYLTRQFSSLTANTRLTMRDIRVLLFLVNNPGLDTARDICEIRGLPKSQVSQAVELLCSRGLLLRRADGSDRRIVHLWLTESGRSVACAASEVQSSCVAHLMDGFSSEEKKQLHNYLSRIMENGNSIAEVR